MINEFLEIIQVRVIIHSGVSAILDSHTGKARQYRNVEPEITGCGEVVPGTGAVYQSEGR